MNVYVKEFAVIPIHLMLTMLYIYYPLLEQYIFGIIYKDFFVCDISVLVVQLYINLVCIKCVKILLWNHEFCMRIFYVTCIIASFIPRVTPAPVS